MGKFNFKDEQDFERVRNDAEAFYATVIKDSRWEHVLKDVTFYEFIAVLDNIRIKIIVKEAIGGEKHFWSVIPHWDIDATNSRRILHSGDLEHD